MTKRAKWYLKKAGQTKVEKKQTYQRAHFEFTETVKAWVANCKKVFQWIHEYINT